MYTRTKRVGFVRSFGVNIDLCVCCAGKRSMQYGSKSMTSLRFRVFAIDWAVRSDWRIKSVRVGLIWEARP